jgi:hypothetical protein
MVKLCLIITLTASLVAAWGSLGQAQDYRFRPEMEQFKLKYRGEVAGSVMAMDAAIARPIGLAATIAGTGWFIATLPFTATSGNASRAAQGLIVWPAGWTFDRRLGQEDSRWNERPMW